MQRWKGEITYKDPKMESIMAYWRSKKTNKMPVIEEVGEKMA